jgi:hypothetical protein
MEGRNLDVDILIPTRKLAIEYDAVFSHSWPESEQRDRRKTELLESAGWRVIRVREESPQGKLEPLGHNDVQVRIRNSKGIADTVLRKIEEVCDISIPGLAEYLNRRTRANARQANEYLNAMKRRIHSEASEASKASDE